MSEETVSVSSMVFPRIIAVYNRVPQQDTSHITDKENNSGNKNKNNEIYIP